MLKLFKYVDLQNDVNFYFQFWQVPKPQRNTSILPTLQPQQLDLKHSIIDKVG